MFGRFFSKKNKNADLEIDFSFAGTDMHSHLIPGIDDGSQSLEESMNLIKALYKMGFRKLITTPHVMHDFYKNTSEIILEGLSQLRHAVSLDPELSGLTLEASAEYYLDEGLQDKIEKKDILTFAENYLLFEISYINAPDNLEAVIFTMQTNGYKAVLAHPERYPYWYNDFAYYKKLKDKGVLFQININSLNGYYSPDARKIAEKLIDNKMVEFIGTDTHNNRHIEFLKKSMSEKYLNILLQQGVLNSTL
jgi:protein-tyrosine phosphatase